MQVEFEHSGRKVVDVGAGTDLASVRSSRGYRAFLDEVVRGLGRAWGTTKVSRQDDVRTVAASFLDDPSRGPLGTLFAEGFLERRGDFIARSIRSLAEGFVPAIVEATGYDLSIVTAAVASDLAARVGGLPDPDWRRAVASASRVEMAYVPATGGLAAADVSLRHLVADESAWSVVPDEAFHSLLEMVNVSSKEFLDALAEVGEPDPRLSDVKFEGESLADMWSRFSRPLDIDRPSLLKPAELVDVLRSVPTGGTPLFVARVRLHEILARDPSIPFAISESGMVGVHDFPSGAGRVEPPAARVAFPDGARWRVLPEGHSIAAIHDISHDFFEVSLEDAPDYTPWSRVSDDKWNLRVDANRRVEIVRDTAEDRVEEFWVQTLDADGTPFGPQETAEVWLDIEHARDHGDRLAADHWAPRYMGP